MHTPESLLDIHERSHRSLLGLLRHCRQLSERQWNQQVAAFGEASIRLQIHHGISAERYWIGVLEGRMDADDDAHAYPTVASMEDYREQVSGVTRGYLRRASVDELNTPRAMLTWGDKERVLIPAQIVLRTQTHLYQHQGQILAMCRLLGKPCSGLDYPIA